MKPAKCFLILLLFWLRVPSPAQSTTATILGIVLDQTGSSMCGSHVTARNVETSSTRTVITDNAGRYRIEQLAPGEYEIDAENAGFGKEIHRGILLTVGRDAVVNLR